MITPQPEEPMAWPAWATEGVEIVDYDPAWAEDGARECAHLRQLLEPWLTGGVEHIGSTAVPGLAAKPILDLQAPIKDLAVADAVAGALTLRHWHYVPPELDQRPYRRFFVKVVNGHRAAHLHLMSAESIHWHRQLAFRDALRADPRLIRAYAQLKTDLAQRHRDDREAYTEGTHQFVRGVLHV